jgi:catechol 2,3-dioxygenase-like lactoylglutathione lyase family enzyme
MAVPFTVVGIDHVVLRAADPKALERFYLDVLGQRFERREGKLAPSCRRRVDRHRACRRGRAGWRHIEHRRGQPRSPVPAGRAVRRADPVVVASVRSQNPAQVCLAKDNDVVRTLASDRPISRSANPFCQGEADAVGLSRMPMARNRRVTMAP